MGQKCCVGTAGEKQDEAVEFEDIRDKTQEEIPRLKARAGGKDTAASKLSKYAAREEEEEEVRDEVKTGGVPLDGETTQEQQQEEKPPDRQEIFERKLQELDERKKRTGPGDTPGNKLSAREKELAEEERRQEADRQRKEEIMAEGEVNGPHKIDWEDVDLDIEDDAKEVNCDDTHSHDKIQEIDVGEDEPTPEPGPSSAPSPPVSPLATSAPYCDADWFAANNTQPPDAVLYYHLNETLTLTFKPAPLNNTKLTYTPPSTLHYKTPQHEVYLDLLHDGCTNPRLISPSVPCSVACSEDALRDSAQAVAKAMKTQLNINDAFTLEVRQIAELTLSACTCVVKILGPIGTLDCITALDEMAKKVTQLLAGGKEFCGHKISLLDEEQDSSVTVRLTKPKPGRWSAVVKAPPGESASLLSAPAWLEPDDGASDEEDDD